MLKVLFFGRFREELGCGELSLEFSARCSDLERLLSALMIDQGDKWIEVLSQDNVICAVNQEVATVNLSLSDGDEIAFFPPVTGG